MLKAIFKIMCIFIFLSATLLQPTLQASLPLLANPFTIISKQPILLETDVYDYQGSITIDIKNGDNERIDYSISFTKIKSICYYTQCYWGWVTKYLINGASQVLGYPSASGAQPIFRFDTSSSTNYAISYSNELDAAWKQIINIACQKFNPLAASSTISARISPESTNNINIAGIETKSAIYAEKMTLTTDNLINTKSSIFNVQLPTDQNVNQKVQLGGQFPSLNGFIGVNLNYGQTKKLLNSYISAISDLFNKNSISNIVQTPTSIQADRASKLTPFADNTFQSIDQEPRIQLYTDTAFPGQQKTNIDLKAQFAKMNIDPTAIQITTTTNLQTANRNLQSGKTTGRANRLLQVYTILSYSKLLYSKTVLGKTISLTVQANCQLNLFTSTITCSANLIYNLFGNTKTITVYSFTRNLIINYSWANTYSGNWAFQFAVPLPPPVSFITINFYVKINYYVSINLSAKFITFTPLKYQLKGIIQTGVNTDARASIRVVAIQGGVYIKGTLVKVGTDPTVSLTFNFPLKKLYVNIDWYFWIIAFQFEWGFFWRYWTFWSGWSGIKIIAKWTINGVYAKYPVLVNNYTFNL